MNSGTCLFCRIVRRDVTAHVVHEDDQLLAFLDICPIRPAHTQIVAKQHFASFDETPSEVVAAIVVVGQKLAGAMKRLHHVPRVAFLFTGGDVDHVHAHVVPMHDKTDITSRRYIVEDNLTFRSTPRVPDLELASAAAELRQAFSQLG